MSDSTDPPVTPSEAIAELMADDEYWEENYERDRGMLTDTDRRYLWGAVEYQQRQTDSRRRQDIRGRFAQGLRDIAYLGMLNERDDEKLFNALDEPKHRMVLSNLTHWLYLHFDGDIEWLEQTIALGISNAEKELRDDDTTYYAGGDLDAGIEVDIDVRRGFNVDRIERQLRQGESHTLTPTEIGVLVREGRLDETDLEKLDSAAVNSFIDSKMGRVKDDES